MGITILHTLTELANLTETQRGKHWPKQWNEIRLRFRFQHHKLKEAQEKDKKKKKKGNKKF